MAGLKRNRDSIHGDVHWDELMVKIIDSPEFQRLDQIKQLGFAYLGYRGAKHSRLAHSIGAAHLARKILDHIRKNHEYFGIRFPFERVSEKLGKTDEDKFNSLKKIGGYAALLHDISHIPFSHTLEDEFNEFYVKHDALESTRLYHLLFDKNSELAKVFDREEPYVASLSNNELRRLLFLAIKFKCVIDVDEYCGFGDLITSALKRVESGNSLLLESERETSVEMLNQLNEDFKKFTDENLFHPFISDLFANTICADLLDYILRDAHGTGLHGLEYDKRIFEYFVIVRDLITRKLRLALKLFHKGEERMDVVTEILKIMRSRYRLAQIVYYYRSKAAASTMMCTILRKVGAPPDINPYLKGEQRSILKMTDQNLFEYMRDAIKKYKGDDQAELSKLLEMLEQRKLYKACLSIPHNYASMIALFPALISRYRQAADAEQNKTELQDALNKPLGKLRALIYCPPPKMQAKEIDTLVCLEDRVVPLKLQYKHLAVSAEIEQINLNYRDLWKFFVFLHPDDLKDEIAVSQVITRFCRVTGMTEDEAKRVSPYGFIRENELRERYLREWWKTKRKWVPADAFDDVEEFVKDEQEWSGSANHDELTTRRSYFQRFDSIFFRAQLDRFMSSEGITGTQKIRFQECLLAKFDGDRSEWMGKIESSFSRESHRPRITGSDVFHAALEDFKESPRSLDRYAEKEKPLKRIKGRK